MATAFGQTYNPSAVESKIRATHLNAVEGKTTPWGLTACGRTIKCGGAGDVTHREDLVTCLSCKAAIAKRREQ